MNLEENNMHTLEEEQEKRESVEIDEEEELVEDLIQRKQKINQFNVEGNEALNQTNIQTLNLKVNYAIKPEKEVGNKKVKNTYNLRKKDDCIKFVEKYGNSNYLALAIILCVFEAVSIKEVSGLMKSLLGYLPYWGNGKREGDAEQLNAYIALDTMLQVIGAKRISTDDGQICISLGVNDAQALENILIQFLDLKETIISWLNHLVGTQQYNTVFESYQIVTAFTKMILLDREVAEKYIFPELYRESKNIWLLGNLLFILYEKDEENELWIEMFFRWAEAKETWLWKASYLAYALSAEHDVDFSLESRLKETLAKRIYFLQKVDINFIVSTLFLSNKVRTMFCEILNIAYINAKNKDNVVFKYLYILRSGFYRVNESNIEIPLLICDTEQQQIYLKNILVYIMERNRFRKLFFKIVKAYMQEISNYEYSERIVRLLAAYFYNMSGMEEENVEEILFFLKECECLLAKDIHIFFWGVYEKRRRR